MNADDSPELPSGRPVWDGAVRDRRPKSIAYFSLNNTNVV